MGMTLASGGWAPRLERLATRLQLEPFEKNILLTLTCNVVSVRISPDASSYSYRYLRL